jgi:hypothetical protein
MTGRTNHMNNFEILGIIFNIITHIAVLMTEDKDGNIFDYSNSYQDTQINSA